MEMRWTVVAVVSFFAVQCFLPSASAKWAKSSFETPEDWKFLTRFCFLSDKGRFDFTFKYPKIYGVQQLLLYYDKPGQWEGVYKSSKNCTERRSVLSKVNNQIIDLTNQITDSRNAGCEVYTQDGVEYYNCTDSVTFQAARERWWYLAVARCEHSVGGVLGLKLDYQIHMMNGPDGDFLHHELSADEFYILPVDIAFLLVFIALLVISIICAVVLMSRQMFHTTYKMYMTALSLWIFGLFLECIAWGKYGETGWEEGPTEVVGRIFLAASTAVFLLMLLLLAKGFTVTRGRLTTQSTLRLTVFFSLYVVINVVLFIWEGQFFDEGLVLYFYESPPGYGLLAMRIVAWLWFLYGFFFTIKNHSEKASFYIPFFLFYTAWFWAGPIVTLIAIFAVAKWSREKTVNGVDQLVTLCGYLFFLVLTLPFKANKNFPFHLRVSQVRFSDDENEPSQTYGLSEESRKHLDDLFIVAASPQGLPTSTAYHSSRPPRNSSASKPSSSQNGGYINGGFSISHENDLKTSFDQKSSTLSTSVANSVYEPSNTPLNNEEAMPSLPLKFSGLPPITGRGGSELPPLVGHGGSELPPLKQQNAASQQALPPLGSRLPPLNAGRPVPAIFSSSEPSAPPLSPE